MSSWTRPLLTTIGRRVQTIGFVPPNWRELAITTVPLVGNITAILGDKNNITGNAPVEVYLLPP
jgi:hypothetical protein